MQKFNLEYRNAGILTRNRLPGAPNRTVAAMRSNRFGFDVFDGGRLLLDGGMLFLKATFLSRGRSARPPDIFFR